MKTIQTTCDIPNATAIDLGPLSELKDYELELGPGVKIPGKVFGGAPVKAGGADFSFQVFAPGTEGGFYHVRQRRPRRPRRQARRPQHGRQAPRDALRPVRRRRPRRRQPVRRHHPERTREVVGAAR